MNTYPDPIIPDYCECGQHVDLHDEIHSARMDGLIAAEDARRESDAREAASAALAMQDMWHAAADAIELAAAADIDEDWLLALAAFIHAEAGAQDSLVSLNITILFDDEEQADVARRYVRRAVDEQDRNE
jgi:hypothetical protein